MPHPLTIIWMGVFRIFVGFVHRRPIRAAPQGEPGAFQGVPTLTQHRTATQTNDITAAQTAGMNQQPAKTPFPAHNSQPPKPRTQK